MGVGGEWGVGGVGSRGWGSGGWGGSGGREIDCRKVSARL